VRFIRHGSLAGLKRVQPRYEVAIAKLLERSRYSFVIGQFSMLETRGRSCDDSPSVSFGKVRLLARVIFH